ncbi:sodium/potassium/calcium exchanger 5-like [Ptychodera flava]|uniref:sodium/potassium/calcium exchanger 5-like n=1 Tax=Ptychodera flava TaxID=63121 RepID=UPI00396AA03D
MMDNSNLSETVEMSGSSDPSAEEVLPGKLFTLSQLRHGAVIIHILVLAYMIHGMVRVSGRYFIPSMEALCKRFNISDDVAGAAPVAFGSSAGELIITVIGIFQGDQAVSFGTVLGANTFCGLLIVGVCGLLMSSTVVVDWWPVFRDTMWYEFATAVAVIMLVAVDGNIDWTEATILIILYILYVIFVGFDKYIGGFARRTVDNLGCRCGGQESEPLSGLESVDSAANYSSAPTKGDGYASLDGQEKEIDDEKDDAFELCEVPNSCLGTLFCIIEYPISAALYCTIPDCRSKRWKPWFAVTAFMSLVWLGVFAYFILQMLDVIGKVLGIPKVLTGLLFAGPGANLPPLIVSIQATRKGHVDMALANAIGGNLFNSLLVFGVPWLVDSLIHPVSGWNIIWINTKNPWLIAFILLLPGILTITCLRLNRWRFNRKIGAIIVAMYVVLLIASIVFELLN